jgi:phospholipid/cholesterol/gamma-HCH transport system ATP-binding protein
MSASTDILHIQDLTIATASKWGSGLCQGNAWLAPGELAMVLLDKQTAPCPLADAAEGLVAPVRGTVAFLGQDWQDMSADRAAQQRGRIGRVFEGESWLSDLNVDQNITLAQRHHSHRPVHDIEREANDLCHTFGLPGLPRCRAASLSAQDLQKAACVRAFLGAPVLILLEEPTRDGAADLLPALIMTAHAARQRGAALLWTTLDPQVWGHPELRATTRWRICGWPASSLQKEGEVT